MIQLSEPLQQEYERWCRVIGDEDPYVSENTLGIFEVLKAHFIICDYFYEEGYGIGAVGPKDLNVLHSSLYRQFSGYGGVRRWTDDFEVCATIMYGLIKDHPFHDANKRTAFLSTVYLLEKTGRWPTVNHKEFENFTVDISEDKFAEKKRYQDLLRKGDDAEIRFIAQYLKKNTRPIDKRYYRVTYRDLKRILQRYGFDLINPKGNYIDVVKIRKKRRLLGFSRETTTSYRKLCTIGFPGMGTQINQKAIRSVRHYTKLTPEDGVDSAAFFQGLDGLQILLAQYQEPLSRLADR